MEDEIAEPLGEGLMPPTDERGEPHDGVGIVSKRADEDLGGQIGDATLLGWSH